MSDCEGKWRLLNPLSIRFSQPRIAPHFRDGHLLDETSSEVYEAPLAPDADGRPSAPPDSACGVPPYDVVLVPPFPAIRVISWLPKLRRPDGEAERDVNGDHILGKRAWFALDNRRLHSMQRAAAQRWPRRCCVVVRCIEEVPGTTIRELRKFRTTTEGRSIEVGVRVGETIAWSWHLEAPRGALHGASLEDVAVEPDGLFAEDLWDAESWAPHALAKASEAGVAPEEETYQRMLGERRNSRHQAYQQQPPPQQQQQRPEPCKARAAQQPPAAAQAQAPANGAGKAAPLAGGRQALLAACPASGWEYVDPSGKVQGPFALDKMRIWHQHSFFYPTLPMRCDPGDDFVPFAELWPPSTAPFASVVVRYKA